MPIIFVILTALFILYKWAVYNLDAIGTYFDTTSYAMVADVPLLDKRFWLRERPFTIPLFYKLLGVRGELYLLPSKVFEWITHFQLIISIVSWIVLGLAVAKAMRGKWVKTAAYTTVLLFAGAIDLSQWDRLLLSESLSLSLFALFLALFILGFQYWERLWRAKSPKREMMLILFLLVTTLYAFTRDVNAYFVFFATIIIAVYSWFRLRGLKTLRIALSIVVLLFMIFLAQLVSSDVGHRWFGPFRNVFFARILPTDQAMEYFLDAGLPLEAQERTQLKGYDRVQFMEVFSSPSYQAVNEWLMENGRSVYLAYLLNDPIASLTAPVQDIVHLVSPDSTEYRKPIKDTPGWLISLSRILFPRSLLIALLLPLISGALILFTAGRQTLQAWWIVPYLLLLTVYPLMFIVFHGDAIELERHALQISMQVRLAGWMLLLALVDVIASKMRYSKVF